MIQILKFSMYSYMQYFSKFDSLFEYTKFKELVKGGLWDQDKIFLVYHNLSTRMFMLGCLVYHTAQHKHTIMLGPTNVFIYYPICNSTLQ